MQERQDRNSFDFFSNHQLIFCRFEIRWIENSFSFSRLLPFLPFVECNMKLPRYEEQTLGFSEAEETAHYFILQSRSATASHEYLKTSRTSQLAAIYGLLYILLIFVINAFFLGSIDISK